MLSDQNSYRERIYGAYSSARVKALAPANSTGLIQRSPYIRKLIRQHFPAEKSAKIVELGCGHGAIIHFALGMGYKDIKGVDASKEQVDAARQLGLANVVQGDVMATLEQLEPDSIDCVLCFDVVEHFTKSEIIDLVDAVYRVLKPSGRWIIHVPNGESPFFGRVLYGDYTHETIFTQISINQLLRSSGFSQVECYEDKPIVHGVKSLARYLIWRVFRSTISLLLAAETGQYTGFILSQNFLSVARKQSF